MESPSWSTRSGSAPPISRLMRASARVGRIWDVDIRVHWLLPPVLLAVAIWMMAIYGWTARVLVLGVGSLSVALIGGVLLHELGHVFAARAFRLPANEVILHPLGGLAVIGHDTRNPRVEFLVAFAGPATNLLLVVAGMLAYRGLGGDFDLAMLWPLIESQALRQQLFDTHAALYFLHTWVSVQSLLALFNLALLAYPMDGGRMLCALFWARRGRVEGIQMGLLVGRAAGAVALMAGLWHHAFALIAIGALTWGIAHGMLQSQAAAREPMGFAPAQTLQDWEPRPDPPSTRRLRYRRAGPLRRLLVRWRARRLIAHEQRLVDDRQRVELLLGKISTDGIESLTDEERTFLSRASQSFTATSSDDGRG